jgi:hypothetical protein
VSYGFYLKLHYHGLFQAEKYDENTSKRKSDLIFNPNILQEISLKRIHQRCLNVLFNTIEIKNVSFLLSLGLS